MIDSIEKILAPVTTDEFLAENWGSSMRVIEGAADKFADLLTWDQLNELLDADVLQPPRLRLVKGGYRLDPSRFMRATAGQPSVNPAGFVNCLNEGAGMVIDLFDRLVPAVRSLTENVEHFFGTRTQVNLYAGWKASKAFELHWDPHDVIVMQVSGDKSWEVHGPSRLHPLIDEEPDPPTNGPVWQGTLTQGDMIYLPRGWWHRAVALDEPSLHLTLGVIAPSAAEYLESIEANVPEDPIVRANLPLPGRPIPAELVAADDSLNKEAIQAFIANRQAETRVRTSFAFPGAPEKQTPELSDHTLVTLAMSRGLTVVPADDGQIVVTTGGISATCAAELEPAVQLLNQSGGASIADLKAALEDASLERKLTVLFTILSMKGALWTT